MQSGGKSGKLGDRYELFWVIRRLLELLAGNLQSVSYERIGEDERGVDLWITDESGNRTAEQCKRQNGQNSSWTIRTLETEGVVGYISFQLTRLPHARYRFVSSVPAPALRDLCERARSTDDHAILLSETLSHQELGPAFRQMCKAWKLGDSQEGQLSAIKLLARCEWDTSPSGQVAVDDLHFRCRVLLDSDPKDALAHMLEMAFEPSNWGRDIDQSELCRLLAERGLRPRQLINDPRIPTQIEKLQSQFFEGFAERTADEVMLVRSQVDDIMQEVIEHPSNRLLIVTGAAGYGKSAVLVDLARRLHQNGIPVLPFRLDDQPIDTTTARAFGQQYDLPDSPGVVLGTYHKARTSVLILDQLDAIRWNVAHSAKSWRVFREIVKEAQALGNVRVVVACRAFDLENEPLFKDWEAKKEAKSFDIGELSEESLKKELGEDRWNSFLPTQQKVLRRALNLHIWRTLSASGNAVVSFDSGLDLMKAFWQDRYLRIRESSTESENATRALELLVQLLQKDDDISAHVDCFPSHLLGGLSLLQSLGIVRRRANRILFWHQTLGDYLIAEHVLQQFNAQQNFADSFFTWIGTRDQQTLFRRGRAQLVLQLAAGVRRHDFIGVVRRSLLCSDNRFHIKLLALQVLAELTEPTVEEQQFVVELIGDDYWGRHLKREVLHGKPNWLGSSLIKQLIEEWINAGSPPDSGTAAWLLASVNATLGKFVAQCIEAWEKKGGDFVKHSEYLMSFSNVSECDELFELRLQLTRQGRLDNYVNWVDIADHNSTRFVRLTAAWLESFLRRALQWLENIETTNHVIRDWAFGPVSKDKLAKLLIAVRSNPELTWQQLFPQLADFAVKSRKGIRSTPRRKRWIIQGRARDVRPHTREIEELLVAAGLELARKDSSHFLKMVSDAPFGSQRYLARIVFRSLNSVPVCFADDLIEFLIRYRAYWGCGKSAGKMCWDPVGRLLKKYGSRCSQGMLERVENAITAWRRPVELRSIKDRHRYDVPFRYLTTTRFGEAARYLLAALPFSRLSSNSRGWLGCLRRKFSGCRTSVFGSRPKPRGGFVGSSISSDKSRHFSDTTWLRLIATNGVSRTHKHWGRRSIRESSAEMFARDLQQAAEREPSRFARLACRMPLNTAHVYFEQLWWALASDKPKAELSENEKAGWTPASVDELETLHRYLKPLQIRGVDVGICRAVECRAEEQWSTSMLQVLLEFCSQHPSPAQKDLIVVQEWENRSIDNLETTAINHVRSFAAFAISEVARCRNDLGTDVEHIASRMIHDEHPSVQIASILPISSLWKTDRDKSFELFERLVASADDHILGSRYTARYLNVAQNVFAERLEWILCRMLRSDIEEVRHEAASRICVLRWWFDGFQDYYNRIRHSSAVEIRKGICEVLERVVANSDRPEGSIEDFAEFFNDSSSDLREIATRAFYRWSDQSHDCYSQLARMFVGTQAFRDDPTEFCHAANEVSAPMRAIADAVFAVCKAVNDFAKTQAAPDRRVDHVRELPQLLLRIYDECQDSQDKQLQVRCLDAWDTLLEAGIQKAQQQLADLAND